MSVAPYGPYSLTGKGQVSIPKELREALGLNVRDKVYFAQDPRIEGALVVVPMSGLARWMSESSDRVVTKRESGRVRQKLPRTPAG
jgi:bifunctional DNA-binding transcriptional regulator/antitoxin component of YhaV-PrlF toxin-antitoxin module